MSDEDKPVGTDGPSVSELPEALNRSCISVASRHRSYKYTSSINPSVSVPCEPLPIAWGVKGSVNPVLVLSGVPSIYIVRVLPRRVIAQCVQVSEGMDALETIASPEPVKSRILGQQKFISCPQTSCPTSASWLFTVAVRLTHAAIVKSASNEKFGISTQLFVPSKLIAFPTLPGAKAALPCRSPVLPFPEPSEAVVPLVSSKAQ